MAYIDAERHETEQALERDDDDEHNTVDVVLSDMCEPWPLVDGFFKNTVKRPYFRMMNTSGIALRDHAGSMVCFCFCSFFLYKILLVRLFVCHLFLRGMFLDYADIYIHT